MVMLEFRHLYTLTAIRANGSLVAAAEDLHLTASAVSHQLKEIENYYEVKLVNRKTRPLTFTPAGEEVLRLADKVLPLVFSTKSNIKRLAHGQTGRLRLASECHSCFDWLMPILNQYRREWADVELDLPEPHGMLLDDEIDLLITSSDYPLEGIHYQPLFEYESRLIMSPTHSLVEQDYIEPHHLRDEVLITYPVEPERLDVIAKFLRPANIIPKRIRTTDLTAMLVQLVASDKGVAALPDWVVAEYEKKGWVVSRRLGRSKQGVRCQLWNSQNLAYMQGFAKLLEGAKVLENVKNLH